MKKFNGKLYKEAVVKTVCERYNLSSETLMNNAAQRFSFYVKVRHIIMFFLGEFTDMSDTEISAVFGKCRTVFQHSRKTVGDLCDTDFAYKSDIDDLRLVLTWRLTAIEDTIKSNIESPIKEIFDAALTVGQLKSQLAKFDDNLSFGFRNQPMQRLHHVKTSQFEAVVFQ